MGGLILDNVIVFLYRLIVPLIKEYRSRAWPQTKGILTEAHAHPSYAYPLAEVTYSYTVGASSYSGLYKRGFWSRDSAVRFVERLAPQTDLTVRYRPDAPQQSFLSRKDQTAAQRLDPGQRL